MPASIKKDKLFRALLLLAAAAKPNDCFFLFTRTLPLTGLGLPWKVDSWVFSIKVDSKALQALSRETKLLKLLTRPPLLPPTPTYPPHLPILIFSRISVGPSMRSAKSEVVMRVVMIERGWCLLRGRRGVGISIQTRQGNSCNEQWKKKVILCSYVRLLHCKVEVIFELFPHYIYSSVQQLAVCKCYNCQISLAKVKI